jgi:hypothetical protein
LLYLLLVVHALEISREVEEAIGEERGGDKEERGIKRRENDKRMLRERGKEKSTRGVKEGLKRRERGSKEESKRKRERWSCRLNFYIV